MDEKDCGLDRLTEIYGKLNDGDKEKVIRLAEGLLNSQKKGKITDLESMEGVYG